MHTQLIIQNTQTWLTQAVIGLNLCPFAKAVHVKNQIHYVVSAATSVGALFDELCTQLQHLANTPAEQTDTTLLIHPQVLTDFLDYNDFLPLADMALQQLGYQGTLQIASFHPQFQFDQTDAHDISNATNRAPYPMLHLLRESSIDRAVKAFPQADAIFEANIQTMKRLGASGWAELAQTWTK